MNVTVHKISEFSYWLAGTGWSYGLFLADNTFGSLPTPAGTNFAACVKGAPNYLLSRCSAVLGNDGLGASHAEASTRFRAAFLVQRTR